MTEEDWTDPTFTPLTGKFDMLIDKLDITNERMNGLAEQLKVISSGISESRTASSSQFHWMMGAVLATALAAIGLVFVLAVAALGFSYV